MSMSEDEVAELLKNLFGGDECACNFNGLDEWLPQRCKYVETGECPNPKDNGCWKQFLAQGGAEYMKEHVYENSASSKQGNTSGVSCVKCVFPL